MAERAPDGKFADLERNETLASIIILKIDLASELIEPYLNSRHLFEQNIDTIHMPGNSLATLYENLNQSFQHLQTIPGLVDTLLQKDPSIIKKLRRLKSLVQKLKRKVKQEGDHSQVVSALTYLNRLIGTMIRVIKRG